MTDGTGMLVRAGEAGPYASREDFGKIFTEGLNSLYQLSFLLTADHKKAEKCFVAGIEDCVNENHVFREWARSWAKRAIIQNAIRELKPRPSRSGSLPTATVSSYTQQPSTPSEHFSVEAVLGLADFERFVFVMSVLENYSPHACALLLGCSSSEVRQARAHALAHLAAERRQVPFTPELSAS